MTGGPRDLMDREPFVQAERPSVAAAASLRGAERGGGAGYLDHANLLDGLDAIAARVRPGPLGWSGVPP